MKRYKAVGMSFQCPVRYLSKLNNNICKIGICLYKYKKCLPYKKKVF